MLGVAAESYEEEKGNGRFGRRSLDAGPLERQHDGEKHHTQPLAGDSDQHGFPSAHPVQTGGGNEGSDAVAQVDAASRDDGRSA